MALEMIGMELDEAWNQIVAIDVFGWCRNIAGDHLEDLAVTNDHRPLDDLVGKHHAGISEEGLGHAATSAAE